MVRMIVHGLTIDPGTNSPILLLKEPEGEKSLPIWIGLLEATAIASQLEKVSFSRPMTHDLLKNTINQLGYTISKIEVCDLKDNTFFALVHLLGPEGEMVIDSRPSDAIALALRADAPIFVAAKVLELSGVTGVSGTGENEDAEEKWKEMLESMDPEDFGKYKM